MIIEFTAAPGSGKTYLADQLKNYLQQDLELKNYKIYTRNDLRKANQKFNRKFLNTIHSKMESLLLMDFNIIKICTGVLISNRKVIDKKKAILYILYNIKSSFIIDKIKNKEPNSIFILDEGLLHVAGVYLDNDINKQKLQKYVNNIKKINKSMYMKQKKIYVLIESDVFENFKRMNNRSQGWPQMMKRLNEEEKHYVLDKAFKKTDLYKEVISDELWEMVIINNKVFKESYDEEFSKIKKLIKEQHIEERYSI